MEINEIVCSIIVPLYNEETVIKETYQRLKAVMDSTKETYDIIFVNDGSQDGTAEIAKEICRKDRNVKLLSFSRNFGHQAAITAGMDYSDGRAIIVIDADLQDPPEVMLQMIGKWRQGFDVVYGVRIKRKGESCFKKFTAKLFYRTLNKITDIRIPVDTGDFRLIDRKVCDALKTLPERNRYVRGLISWLGFRQTGVEFIREERFSGKTKYPLKKMNKFALDAITSFSYKPLKLATYIGSAISVFSLLILVAGLVKTRPATGVFQNLMFLITIGLFFNGLLFIMLGIIGEYIVRICDETKGRPLYIVGDKEGFL
jgi:polyisoprenyl-phosphate glycosyltransferase